MEFHAVGRFPGDRPVIGAPLDPFPSVRLLLAVAIPLRTMFTLLPHPVLNRTPAACVIPVGALAHGGGEGPALAARPRSLP